MDRWFLCSRIYGRRTGWTNFRCVQFKEQTAHNAWIMIGIVIILLPLTAYFTIIEGLDYFCVLQSSNLYFETEQFALIGFKACMFILMFPFFEFLFDPQLRKCLKSFDVQQFTLIGVGALIVTGAVIWCSVLQHLILNENDYLIGPNQPSGHLVLLNAISSPTKVRGEHLNTLKSFPRNAWVDLEPYVPFKVLHVPLRLIPFGISLFNINHGIYDDFNLTFVEDKFNWFVIFPERFVQLPTGTFHRVPEVAADPQYFSPAIVNVLCRLPLCRGYLEFRKSARHYERVYYPQDETVVTLRLAGKYVCGGKAKRERYYDEECNSTMEYSLTFAMVGNTSGVHSVTYTFRRLGIYIVTILPLAGKHVGASVSHYASVKIVPTSTSPDTPYAWIYPVTFFHALSELFSKAPLYAWLYDVSPPELRSTAFCLTMFFSLPCYILIIRERPLALQKVRPVALFSLSCIHGFCLIIFCCSCIYYCRRTVEEATDSMKSRELGSESSPSKNKNEAGNNTKKMA